MSFVANRMITKGIQNGVVAVALGFGLMAGLASAAPISPGSVRSAQIEAPIEKTQVVVHHRRPVVVHHHRRPATIHRHPRRHQVCWWSHGRRVCRWR